MFLFCSMGVKRVDRVGLAVTLFSTAAIGGTQFRDHLTKNGSND
jgi:hypothetical protein